MTARWTDALCFAVVAGVVAVLAAGHHTRAERAACWVLAAVCAGFCFAELIAIGRRRAGRDE